MKRSYGEREGNSNVPLYSCLGRPIRVESYRGRPPSRTRSCPASSDEEALNEILAQRESRKRRSSETLTASEAPPLSPPVPPRVQESRATCRPLDSHRVKGRCRCHLQFSHMSEESRNVPTRSTFKQEDSNSVEEPRSPAPRRLPPKFSSRARNAVN